MWQLWWICSSQKPMSSARKNWSFCSCLQIKTSNCGPREYWSNVWSNVKRLVCLHDQLSKNKKPQINGKTVEMMIDSGAFVNLLDETTFQRINSSGNENLKPTHTKIYSYGCETPLPLLGTFTATVKSSNASTSAPLLS